MYGISTNDDCGRATGDRRRCTSCTDRFPLGRGISLLRRRGDRRRTAVLRSRSLFRYYGPDFGRQSSRSSRRSARASVPRTRSPRPAALRRCGVRSRRSASDAATRSSFLPSRSSRPSTPSCRWARFRCSRRSIVAQPRPALLRRRCHARTAAVIPVHLENVAADMDPILDLARRPWHRRLEDTAQSHRLHLPRAAPRDARRPGRVLAATREEHHRWRRRGGHQRRPELGFGRPASRTKAASSSRAAVGPGRRTRRAVPRREPPHDRVRRRHRRGAAADSSPGLLDAMRANKHRILTGVGDVPRPGVAAASRSRRRRLEQHHVVRTGRGPAAWWRHCGPKGSRRCSSTTASRCTPTKRSWRVAPHRTRAGPGIAPSTPRPSVRDGHVSADRVDRESQHHDRGRRLVHAGRLRRRGNRGAQGRSRPDRHS